MRKAFLPIVLASFLSSSATHAAEEAVEQLGPFNAGNLAVIVRAEGPATRNTPLQAACFFEHQASGDKLSGGTETFNEKMGGLIKKLRDNGEFGGHELETLLITPPSGTVPAKKILLIGLGNPNTFLAERMKNVGRVAVREAFKLGVDKLSLSPNVTDAGVSTVKVVDFDQKLVEGVLDGYATQMRLAKDKLVPHVVLKEFTLEAGKANLPGAAQAVQSAIKAQSTNEN